MAHASAFWQRQRRALAACVLLTCVGCASKSWREVLEEKRDGDGTRKSGPALDHFYMDNPFQKDRPPSYKEFFYKRCEFMRRTPVPSQAEWACSDPSR